VEQAAENERHCLVDMHNALAHAADIAEAQKWLLVSTALLLVVVTERNKILSVPVDILKENFDSLSLGRLADSSS
jgi:hypothetical protein